MIKLIATDIDGTLVKDGSLLILYHSNTGFIFNALKQ